MKEIAILNESAVKGLIPMLEEMGWQILRFDLDFTQEKPCVDIEIKSFQGRVVYAYADRFGRTGIERFQDGTRTTLEYNGKKCGGKAIRREELTREFLGRQRYEGIRPMLAGLVQYLVDNSVSPVSLERFEQFFSIPTYFKP